MHTPFRVGGIALVTLGFAVMLLARTEPGAYERFKMGNCIQAELSDLQPFNPFSKRHRRA